MSRNVEVHDPTAMMLQHNKNKQELELQRRNHEEIGCDDLGGVVLQESPPRLGRRLAVADHVLGDRSFGDFDSKFQQFAMNPRCTPNRIGQTHLTNQIPNRP